MSLKQKFLAMTFVVLLAFGGGLWVGYQMDRGDVDPQDYIQTVFTPYDDGIASYLSFLDQAGKSVRIADYAFTDPRITDKLIELKSKRSVDVRLLLDKSQTLGRSGEYTLAQIERLRQAGIEIVLGTSEKSRQLMHSKYTVVDELYVQSGSWNYTKAANSQANTLDFIKSRKRARLFLDNWQRMYKFMKSQQAQSGVQS